MFGRGGKQVTLPKTDFFIGAAVSPFKRHERELMPQYYKLLRKIRAGAQWVIPQLGYDMRKFNEVKLLLVSRGLAHIPVIGNVFLLTRGLARLLAVETSGAALRLGFGQKLLPDFVVG